MQRLLLQDFFPSSDGSADKREQFIGILTDLVTKFDNLKDPNRANLKGEKNRGGDFYNQLALNSEIPYESMSYDKVLHELIELVKDNPLQTKYYLTNAIPMASIPAILGMLTSFLINGNILWDVYGPAGAEAEVKVVSMMSKLIGYDAEKSGGYATWGGQGCILSALRVAISKFAPDALETGIPNNLYVFASEAAHFSLFKSVEATGLGRDKLVKVKVYADNAMDVQDLRRKMATVIARGGIPIYVVATIGTTDSFAMDDLQAIHKVCKEMEMIHRIQRPYIHADSAMGGFYTFFNDYDLEENRLQFSISVIDHLRPLQSKLRHLHLADSVTFDFHKFGQAPYSSSCFVIKEGKSLGLVDIPSEETPYVGNRGYGSYHTGYTLESSRGASSIGMYSSLLAFGVEGYQRLLAQYLEVNQAFRDALMKIPGLEIVNADCSGPITLFRIYPEGSLGYFGESAGLCSKEEIEAVNQLNETLYELFGANRAEIFLGDTKKFRMVTTRDEQTVSLNASKIFVMSPYTELQHVEEIVAYIGKMAQLAYVACPKELFT